MVKVKGQDSAQLIDIETAGEFLSVFGVVVDLT